MKKKATVLLIVVGVIVLMVIGVITGTPGRLEATMIRSGRLSDNIRVIWIDGSEDRLLEGLMEHGLRLYAPREVREIYLDCHREVHSTNLLDVPQSFFDMLCEIGEFMVDQGISFPDIQPYGEPSDRVQLPIYVEFVRSPYISSCIRVTIDTEEFKLCEGYMRVCVSSLTFNEISTVIEKCSQELDKANRDDTPMIFYDLLEELIKIHDAREIEIQSRL